MATRRIWSKKSLQRDLYTLITGLSGGFLVGALFGDEIRARGVGQDDKTSREVEVKDKTGQEVTTPIHTALRRGSPEGPLDILYRQAFVVAYDRVHRHPLWTAEHLNADKLSKTARTEDSPDRSRSVFKEDDGVDLKFRAKLSDYMRSGYDRGHMVPAADAKQSQTALDETFALSNIAPQVGDGFNRDYWAHFEDFARRLVTSFKDVYVLTIPLYLPKQYPDGKWRVAYEVIGGHPNGVGVPTHFAKVILAQGAPLEGNALLDKLLGHKDALAIEAFVLPNAPIQDTTPLTSFVVPVDAVERASGLSLFKALHDRPVPLCQLVKCDIIVRQFADRRKSLSNASNTKGLPLS